MDEQKLKKTERHIKNAWVAGLISAGITFIFSIIGSYSVAFRQKYGIDAWALLDVALILGLTYGIYKKSRFSALAMLIYFVISKIIMVVEIRSSVSLVALLFIYFFYQGTIATFRLHKYAIETGKLVKKKRGPLMYIAIGGASLVVLAVGILIILSSLGPEAEVISGKQLKAKYVSAIEDLGLLDTDEEILYWYSDALLDFMKGFYFFTNKKVVVYSSDFDNPAIIVFYLDILDINIEYNPSIFVDSQITLLLDDGTEVFFPVSSDNMGDEKFYNQLVSTWQRKRESIIKQNF